MAPNRLSNLQEPLHLYRHLLREASYLPPIARPFFTNRIVSRFRRHANLRYTAHTSDHTSLSDALAMKRLRQAHHDLRFLRAANAGDLQRMRRVLLLVFGRIGQRRRELVDELVRPMATAVKREETTPADTTSLTEAIRRTVAAAEPERMVMKSKADPLDDDDYDDWLAKWDVDKVTAYLQSQKKAGIVNSPRPELKHVDPHRQIPKENVWGRPLADRISREKLKRAWAKLINRALPPLPEGEWELLGELSRLGQKAGTEKGDVAVAAMDSVSWMGRPRNRRLLARSPPDEEDGGPHAKWKWREYAVKRVQRVDKDKSRRNMLLSGQSDEHAPRFMKPLNRHKFTARGLRRLYGGLWCLTSRMKEKHGGKGWQIEWGGIKFRSPMASGADSDMFKGIPSTGKSNP